jgi:hypothetical protein
MGKDEGWLSKAIGCGNRQRLVVEGYGARGSTTARRRRLQAAGIDKGPLSKALSQRDRQRLLVEDREPPGIDNVAMSKAMSHRDRQRPVVEGYKPWGTTMSCCRRLHALIRASTPYPSIAACRGGREAKKKKKDVLVE